MWENLPDDIVDQILGLLWLSDLIRSGVVCKTWYAVFLQKKHHRIERINNEVPLVFIPTNFTHVNTSDYAPNQVCNVFEKKCLISMSPVTPIFPLQSTILNTCYGWLATLIQEKGGITIILNNPTNGNTITLPTTYLEFKHLKISMVVLSCDPSIYPDKCVVAYLRPSYKGCVGFVRLGGKKWTEFTSELRFGIKAIVFHKGKLYALTCERDLVAIHCHWESNNGDKCDFRRCHVVEMNGAFKVADGSPYLVESLRGELLMVVHDYIFYKKFVVYKLVITHEDGNENMKGHWVQTDRLGYGDEVLFLSGSHNVICSKCQNLEPNSVYYFKYNKGYYQVKVYTLNMLEWSRPNDYTDFGVIRRKQNESKYECIELGVTFRKQFGFGEKEPVWINPSLQ